VSEPTIRIGERTIGGEHPTFFVADIGANHDGKLERAKALVRLAAESGADAAKFQHFRAETIVSRTGFESLGSQLSHQADWTRSVYEVYKDASLDLGWTEVLRDECEASGIEFMTAPYSLELADALDPYARAFKIGSGDVTWLELVRHIAEKGKPVVLAAGASTLEEVERAVEAVLSVNDQLALLQCNTNYTGLEENLSYVNLRVLNTFRARFPDVVLGLSDHTPGHATALGAVAMGARVVEKHITDDCTRTGPDHAFALDPDAWCAMVRATRELEAALGDGVKRVEPNEAETVVVQRRALRAARDLEEGTLLARDDVIPLRPCPPDALSPAELGDLLGRRLGRSISEGDVIRRDDLA
jgi:N-acetylneuraminate synthase